MAAIEGQLRSARGLFRRLSEREARLKQDLHLHTRSSGRPAASAATPDGDNDDDYGDDASPGLSPSCTPPPPQQQQQQQDPPHRQPLQPPPLPSSSASPSPVRAAAAAAAASPCREANLQVLAALAGWRYKNNDARLVAGADSTSPEAWFPLGSPPPPLPASRDSSRCGTSPPPPPPSAAVAAAAAAALEAASNFAVVGDDDDDDILNDATELQQQQQQQQRRLLPPSPPANVAEEEEDAEADEFVAPPLPLPLPPPLDLRELCGRPSPSAPPSLATPPREAAAAAASSVPAAAAAVVVLTMRLGPGRDVSLVVHPGDDPRRVADTFLEHNGLPASLADAVAARIRAALEGAAAAAVAGAQEQPQRRRRRRPASVSPPAAFGRAAVEGAGGRSSRRRSAAPEQASLRRGDVRAASASAVRERQRGASPGRGRSPTASPSLRSLAVSERLYEKGMQSLRDTEEASLRHREATERAEAKQATFHPRITPVARNLRRRSPLHVHLGRKAAHSGGARAASASSHGHGQASHEERQLQACTFMPQLSERSKRIAKRMRFEASPGVAFASLYLDAELRKTRCSEREASLRYAAQ